MALGFEGFVASPAKDTSGSFIGEEGVRNDQQLLVEKTAPGAATADSSGSGSSILASSSSSNKKSTTLLRRDYFLLGCAVLNILSILTALALATASCIEFTDAERNTDYVSTSTTVSINGIILLSSTTIFFRHTVRH